MLRPIFPPPDSSDEVRPSLHTGNRYDDERRSAGAAPARSAVAVPDVAPTDAELLMQFQRHGDEEAFAALVGKHGPMVMAVCRQVLRRQADAEDAYQAVWIVLMRRSRAIRNRASLGGWLYRVAHRTALRAARRRHRQNEVAMQDQHTECVDPLAAVGRHSLVRELLEEVDALPERYRDPLVLVYLQGKSYAEAAGELECTPAALRGRLTRGKRMLRTRLLRQGVSLAAALAASHATLASRLAHAEMARLVELARIAATSASGAPSVSTGNSGGATELKLSETTVSLAKEGMQAMLLTSMTAKVAATVLVLCAGVGLVALQDDGQAVAAAQGNGAAATISLDAESDDANAEAEEAAVVAPTPSKANAGVAGETSATANAVNAAETYERAPLPEAFTDRPRNAGGYIRAPVELDRDRQAAATPSRVGTVDRDSELAAEELRIQGRYLDMQAEAMKLRFQARQVEVKAVEAEGTDEQTHEQLMRESRRLDAEAGHATPRPSGSTGKLVPNCCSARPRRSNRKRRKGRRRRAIGKPSHRRRTACGRQTRADRAPAGRTVHSCRRCCRLHLR
ncbi:MAG: sigma-70 family RNA polymerase sigma factor [Pirellulales bacterium]